jgi:hypothetical protein
VGLGSYGFEAIGVGMGVDGRGDDEVGRARMNAPDKWMYNG